MEIKGIIDYDTVNYKKNSLTIEFPYCSFKCDKDFGSQICQNCELVKEPNINIAFEEIYDIYVKNTLTNSVVMQGLEPFDSWEDLSFFVKKFRSKSNDDIVIYTGYCPEEIFDKIVKLSKYKNIIIKFGRFIPNSSKHHDEVLGVNLASDNQYAIKVS